MAEANKTAAPSPGVPFTETPEFKAAVAAAVAVAVPEVAARAVAELAKHGAPVGAGIDPDATGLMEKLALAIAEISDQGTKRKRVAPEILAARARAAEKAEALILECRTMIKQADETGDRAMKAAWSPEYKVIAKIYFNERFIEPWRRDQATKQAVPNEIVWTGMPNEALRPINDIAKRIFALFKESIGSSDKIASIDSRPVWLTARGLVVKGDAPARMQVAGNAGFADGLEVKLPNDPTAPEVHVLGTIAPPARQNFQGADSKVA